MPQEYNYLGDRLRHIENKHLQLIKPGTITKHTTYNKKTRSYSTQNSMFSNHILQDQNIIQHYGFASAPLSGSKTIVLGIAGSNTNNLIIGTHDNRYLPTNLLAGEVVVHDYQGQAIELRQNQTININSMKTTTINVDGKKQITVTDGQIEISGDVTIDKDVTINGKLHVKGQITSDDDVIASSISLKNHTHTSGKEGAPTSPPA